VPVACDARNRRPIAWGLIDVSLQVDGGIAFAAMRIESSISERMDAFLLLRLHEVNANATDVQDR
jgi:hypothetical protein